MANSALDQPGENTVTLVRWSKKPGRNPFIRFVMLSIFGVILCLILMIFLPGLRSFGAVAFFTVAFAAIFTTPAVSSQRSYMRGLTRRVNDAVLEVTGNPGDQLSVKQFRGMMKSGGQLSLPVSGVPGLNLRVARAPRLEKEAPEQWLVVFTVIPPEDGTASFDRLVAAAIAADPESTGLT